MKSGMTQHEMRWFLIMVAPALAGFFLLVLGPMIASLALSFMAYNVTDPARFVGLSNYTYLFNHEPTFWPSMKVTLIFTAAFVPLNLILSLGAAMLISERIRAVGFYRTALFMPTILPATASGIVFLWLFNPRFGIINGALDLVGIEGPAWTFSTQWALPTLVIMCLWPFGGSMIVFLAGLQSIPRSLTEAAELDGAGRWQVFRHVKIAMLSPIIFFNLLMSTIGAMKIFDQAFVFGMGGPGPGGPARATLFMVLNIYQKAFNYFHMGLASAMAWVLFIIILAITILNFYLRKRWVHSEVD